MPILLPPTSTTPAKNATLAPKAKAARLRFGAAAYLVGPAVPDIFFVIFGRRTRQISQHPSPAALLSRNDARLIFTTPEPPPDAYRVVPLLQPRRPPRLARQSPLRPRLPRPPRRVVQIP